MKSNELIISYTNVIYERRIFIIIPKRQWVVAEISSIIFIIIILVVPTYLLVKIKYNIIIAMVDGQRSGLYKCSCISRRFSKSTHPFPHVRIPLEFGFNSATPSNESCQCEDALSPCFEYLQIGFLPVTRVYKY